MPRSDETPFRRPTEAHIDALAADLGVSLSPDERADYRELVDDAIEGLEGVRHAGSFDAGLAPDDLAGRGGIQRPGPDEDPLNAWLVQCEVEGAATGPLSDLEVGLKDSIALAGVELTAGSRVLEGFVPQIDATVVSRLLDAGATITGKLNMESLAFSGTGDTSDFGSVLNPHDEDRLAGGSSSGSGAAVARGDCDVALGTDQAGSIRIPSAWCGIVGVKPTHGLVPYTGIVPLEGSVDHVGPMGSSVEVVARTLSALAGVDAVDGIRLDARQRGAVDGETQAYEDALGEPVADRSIGVLEEGFGWEASEGAVDDAVRGAAETFGDLGVAVESVSLPLHRQVVSAWAAIATQGGARLFREGGAGTSTGGWAWPGLTRVLDSFRRARADDLPPTVKRTLLAAAFLEEQHGHEAYAKGRDLALRARREYDELLSRYDALLLPTTVTRAFERDPDLDRVAALTREASTILNTAAFDVTGHPAISIPCAKPDGLPVGAMLVGARFDEPTLFALASAFERATDWERR